MSRRSYSYTCACYDDAYDDGFEDGREEGLAANGKSTENVDCDEALTQVLVRLRRAWAYGTGSAAVNTNGVPEMLRAIANAVDGGRIPDVDSAIARSIADGIKVA